MSAEELAEAMMELPVKQRLDLARRIVASVADDQESSAEIGKAIPGIEDIVTGKVKGLGETEFREALK
jgi:hypothetical protein